MSGLTYYSYEGGGEWSRDQFNFNQAVRIDNKIEISGQGGWIYDDEIPEPDVPFRFPEDLEAEIRQAFINVETTLQDAKGKGLSQVYRMTSYHVNMTQEVLTLMVTLVGEYLPHKPLWTVAGLESLALDPMRIELDVVAYDPEGTSIC